MERGCTRLLVIVAICNVLFNGTLSSPVPSDEQPGDRCEMGGKGGGRGGGGEGESGVMGICEEIGECLRSGGIVRNEGEVKICSRQFSGIYVCCRKPHLIAKELCDGWSHYWRSNDGRCAIEHPLIVGGEAANIGEFPHTALLGSKYRNGDISYGCGGTLISPHFVITAAHCLFSYVEGVSYWVKLGEYDREYNASGEVTERLMGPVPPSLYGAETLTFDQEDGKNNLAPVEQVIEVEREFIYPSYSHRYSYHDIALLKLKTPAKLTKRVLPACLPYQFPANDYRGQRLTVVGWGRTGGSHEMSRILQKVEIPVIDRLRCSTTKANSPKNTPLGITEDMICAGEKNKDSCQGDSGGPLTTQTPRNSSSCEHTVVGVVSYGVGRMYSRCGAVGVYTRVSSYLDWITGYIAPNGTGTGYLTTDEAELVSSTSNRATRRRSDRMLQNNVAPLEESISSVEATTTKAPITTTTEITQSPTTEFFPPIIFGDFF